MKLDPAAGPPHLAYSLMMDLVIPRPIAWVTTLSPRGIVNLAPFSSFNAVAANPPTLLFSVLNRRDGSAKDTLRNLQAAPGFVVNVPGHELGPAVTASCAEWPYEDSELDRCGLHPDPAERVAPPRVREARAHFECEVHQIVPVGAGPLAAQVVIGRILLVHVRDDLLDADGRVDPGALDPLARVGSDGFARLGALTRIPLPGRGPRG